MNQKVVRFYSVGKSYICIFNHFKKCQTASAHHNYCRSGDGGCINSLEYTIVAVL